MLLNCCCVNRDLKDKLYDHHHCDDSSKKKSWKATVKATRKGVSSTLNAIANEVEQSAKGKGFFDPSQSMKRRQAVGPKGSPGKPESSPVPKNIKPRRRLPSETGTTLTRRVAMVKNARRFQSLRRHLSYKVGIVPTLEDDDDDANGHSVMRVAKKKVAAAEIAKKIRKVEHVLSTASVFYDSDQEDPKREAKEQAVARMQELAGYNTDRTLRRKHTPRQKLQRILRRALRVYKRQKARGELQQEPEGVNQRTAHPNQDHPDPQHHRFTISDYRHRLTLGMLPFGSTAHDQGKGVAHTTDDVPHRHSFTHLSLFDGGGHASATAATVVAGRDPRRHSHTAGLGERRSFSEKVEVPAHRKTIELAQLPHSTKSGRPTTTRWNASVRTVAFGLHAITIMHKHKRYLTRHELQKIKRRVDRHRRWSFSAIEGSESLLSGVASTAEATARNAPIKAARQRRQSFPSLENDEWRDANTYEAVL
jgi:hypothetical protein